MLTKRQLLDMAFEEIGLAGYVFDISPDEQRSALARMDAMMGVWESQGIRIGYLFPSDPQSSDLDSNCGVTDQATEAIALNLACRLAPGYGKVVAAETRISARGAYMALLSKTMQTTEMQLPGTMPRGAGNKPWAAGPFMTPPDQDPLRLTQGGDLNVLPE